MGWNWNGVWERGVRDGLPRCQQVFSGYGVFGEEDCAAEGARGTCGCGGEVFGVEGEADCLRILVCSIYDGMEDARFNFAGGAPMAR